MAALAAAAAAPAATNTSLFTVAASGGAAGAGLMQGSDSVLAVVVSSPAPNLGTHWLGMFLQGSNISVIERYRNYCYPGGCSPTTPPWTATAPIKFWNLNDGKLLSEFRVHVINYRAPVFFAVFESTDQPRLVARTPPFAFARMRCEPTGVHLARTSSPGQLRVTWQSGEPAGSLRWRQRPLASAPHGDDGWRDVAATSSTYTIDKLCGLPANMSIGWHDPGVIHTASIDATVAETSGRQDIEYMVGSTNCSTDSEGALWSPAFTVTSTPKPTDSVRILFIGDMGEAPRDAPISQHHWQMPKPTEVVDAMIASSQQVDYDAVWHIGDLAYATGYGSIWDGFMRQIEPLATRMPYCKSRTATTDTTATHTEHRTCDGRTASFALADHSGPLIGTDLHVLACMQIRALATTSVTPPAPVAFNKATTAVESVACPSMPDSFSLAGTHTASPSPPTPLTSSLLSTPTTSARCM